MDQIGLITSIAPELENEDTERLEMFIDLASERISSKVFGKLFPQALAYLTAHLVTVSNRGRDQGVAVGGAIKSVTTGGQSISFGGGAPPEGGAGGALTSTPYGEEFLAIRKSRAKTKGILLR